MLNVMMVAVVKRSTVMSSLFPSIRPKPCFHLFLLLTHLLFSAGVVLGGVTEHIELAGTKGDCGSFLILLLAGAATPLFSRNRRVQVPRNKLTQDFFKRISKGISKVSRLRTEYSTILNRGARLSVFDSDSATSRVRSDEQNYSTLNLFESNVSHPETGEDTDLPVEDADLPVGKSDSLSDDEEQLNGTSDLHLHSISTPVTAPSSFKNVPPKNVPQHQVDTAVADRGLSMELGVHVIKNIISLIADCRIEDDEDLTNSYQGDEMIPECVPDTEYRNSTNGSHAATSSLSYSRARQCTGNIPCQFQLWDDFLSPMETYKEHVHSSLERTDPTVQRILRLIMQKGSTATVRETVKTIIHTFGHSSGNVLLGSSRCSHSGGRVRTPSAEEVILIYCNGR